MSNLVTDFSNNSIPPLTLSAIALAASVSALYVLLRQKHMPNKLFLIGMQLFNVIYEISLATCSTLFFLVYLQRQTWLDDPFYFYAIRLVPDILSGFLIYLLLMFDVNLLEVFSVLDETRLTKKVLGLLRVAFTGLFFCLHGWAIAQSIYNVVENLTGIDNPVAIFLRNVSNTTSLVFFAIAMVWDNCQLAYLISKIWDFNKYKSKDIAQKAYKNSINLIFLGLFLEWTAISLYVLLMVGSNSYIYERHLYVWTFFYNTLAQCILCLRMSMNPFLFLQLKTLTFAGKNKEKFQNKPLEVKIGKGALKSETKEYMSSPKSPFSPFSVLLRYAPSIKSTRSKMNTQDQIQIPNSPNGGALTAASAGAQSSVKPQTTSPVREEPLQPVAKSIPHENDHIATRDKEESQEIEMVTMKLENSQLDTRRV